MTSDGALPGLGDRTLLFVHLPKTGGTSVADLLGTRFAPNDTLALRSTSSADADRLMGEPDRFRFIHGHVPLDARRAFRGPPFALTILRDPVERSISAYHFLRQTSVVGASRNELPSRQRAAELATRVTLAEFARTDSGRDHVGNQQVQLLARPYAPGWFGRRDTDRAVPTEADLATALQRLPECHAVGLTEHLQQAVELLSYALGCEVLGDVGTANATVDRPARHEIDAGTLAVLEEHTQLDRVLYQAARDLVERRRRDMMRELLAAHGRADRPQVPAEVRFDAAIPGDGWYAPEHDDSGWYSWTGPATSAWLDLATPAGHTGDSAELDVDIAHTILDDPLDGLVVRVNGQRLAWTASGNGGRQRLRAGVPAGLLRPPGAPNRVELLVRATARPCDVWAGNLDSRAVGIALSRMALR